MRDFSYISSFGTTEDITFKSDRGQSQDFQRA